jgi:Uncharacterized conserved protein
MVVIPAGQFIMGDEIYGPPHKVNFTRPYAVGKYEVTFDEYDMFARANGLKLPGDSGWGRGKRPVIHVSWNDAMAYVAWLSEQTGQQYRLPSEAEWEYAARAGTATVYWWGNDAGNNNANCDGCGSQWDDKKTAPVGSFRANAFGLFDTAGNVWEWVQDCWNDSYIGAPGNGVAWTFGDCKKRVARGGSWFNLPGFLRSTHASGFLLGYRPYSQGFRLAKDLGIEASTLRSAQTKETEINTLPTHRDQPSTLVRNTWNGRDGKITRQ